MKISKLRLACLIVIGLYVLSCIGLGISAYRYYASETPPLMAVGYDDLFWVNTQIHIAIFVMLFIFGKFCRFLNNWVDKL